MVPGTKEMVFAALRVLAPKIVWRAEPGSRRQEHDWLVRAARLRVHARRPRRSVIDPPGHVVGCRLQPA